MSVHEVSKEDVQLAILSKSENIVTMNVHKQVYGRPKQQLIDQIGSPKSPTEADDEFAAVLLSQDKISYETVGKGFH